MTDKPLFKKGQTIEYLVSSNAYDKRTGQYGLSPVPPTAQEMADPKADVVEFKTTANGADGVTQREDDVQDTTEFDTGHHMFHVRSQQKGRNGGSITADGDKVYFEGMVDGVQRNVLLKGISANEVARMVNDIQLDRTIDPQIEQPQIEKLVDRAVSEARKKSIKSDFKL